MLIISFLAALSVLTLILLSFFPTGKEGNQPEARVLEGRTMGTTYRVVYFDEPRQRNFQHAVDSLLLGINKAISTYDQTADISRFNKSADGIRPQLPYLYDILKKAKRIYRLSEGAFDPTVMPLVNAWGFGPEKSSADANFNVDSLRQFIGFDKIRFTKKRISKRDPRVQLDMGGIGQGYGADMIFRFLIHQGIEHMLVELGGEGLAQGRNLSKNKPWTIGILDPRSTPEHQFFKAYVELHDEAFTTSGNYFNYRVIDGRKLGHTIDPVSGRPVQHSLLSASVFAKDCATADGWATAFMVMGVEKAIAKVKRVKGMEAFFIYSDSQGELKTFVTPGLQKKITLE